MKEEIHRAVTTLKEVAPESKNMEAIRSALKSLMEELEKNIVLADALSTSDLRSILLSVDTCIKRLSEIETISEYAIIEKHALIILFIRVIILVKMISNAPGIEEEIKRLEGTYKLELLSRNIKVCNGEIDKTKGILIESLFLNVVGRTDASLLRRVEISRALKMKIKIKTRLEGKESELDKYMVSILDGRLDRIIETMVPINKQMPAGRICEILEGIVEAGNHLLIKQLLKIEHGQGKNDNTCENLNVKSVLVGLTVGHTEGSPESKEDQNMVYLLVLKIAVKYIVDRKKETRAVSGRMVLNEIFNEDEIDMMLKVLEKDLPGAIQSEVVNILVEGEIRLLKADSIAITSDNVHAFMRYVCLHPEGTDNVLLNIINALEIDSLEDDDEAPAGDCSPVAILDFLNEMLKRYSKDTTMRGVSFQRYAATTIVDVFNGIISSTSNPLIVCGYLTLLSNLTNITEPERSQKRTATYFGTIVNRNMIFTRCINTIITAMRQLSAFVIQKDSLYVDTLATALPDLPRMVRNEGRGTWTREEDTFAYDPLTFTEVSEHPPSTSSSTPKTPNTSNTSNTPKTPKTPKTSKTSGGEISKSVTLLFKIALHLPSAFKVTLAGNHLMNILFRVLAETNKVPAETLLFVRGFFSSKPVIQKISSSVNSNFFSLIAALVNRGELEAVLEIAEDSNRLYRGFFAHGVVTVEAVKSLREDPALYQLLGSLMIYYYADDPKLRNEAINRTILELFDTVLACVRTFSHIMSILSDTKEFGSFFKACSLLGDALSLKTEDLLYLLMKTEHGFSQLDIKKPSMSVLYKCSSKVAAECFFFHHFVTKGVKNLVPGEERERFGRFCLGEINNPFSSPVLKYISLMGLSAEDVPMNSVLAKSFSEVDFSGATEEQRLLFVNQLYRALFLSGRILEGGSSLSLPFAATETDRVHSYADMCIRAAIKATEETGSPHTLPLSIMSTGSSSLVAALLYMLYESAPNSAVVSSYIKKMRKFVRNDGSIFSRVLSTAP
ncbi:hypothetical protein NEDG_00532 [Nematocida displodere]|uniref:Uncharacterized protein n=1 Tax=Nematocida displodere TaxID=1805483 RepID=A0A177EEI0_9MICR|nr:hypothetical protein NEDG_00532 [Nematocida displodere]